MKAEETLRKCIACGQLRSKSEMLRFVKTPDSRLVPDFDKKIEGRGLYVSNSRSKLQHALEKNLFIKSIHQHLKIDQDFLALVENLLYKRGLNSLNLARKAGAVVSGFEKVKDAVIKGKAAFLVEASDAGEDGRGKIEALAKDLEVLKVYKTADLDQALNKVNTVHIAVLKSNIATLVYDNLKKYQTFLD